MTRFNQVIFTSEQKDRIEQLRKKEEELLEYIEKYCVNSREKSLAITKLEECAMWASKSIASEQI